MDGARLQSIVYRGYAIAAKNIGLPFDQYRPSDPMNPLAPGAKVGTIPCAFTPHGAPDFQFGRPSDHRDALYHGLFNGAVVQPGDIFDGGQGKFLVLSMDPIQPPLCVNANRTVSLLRTETASDIGLNDYGAPSALTESVLLANWPASVLEGGRGKGGVLPSDAGGGPGWEIMMLPWGSIEIDAGDIILDEFERRYLVRGAELTNVGWRLNAVQMVV